MACLPGDSEAIPIHVSQEAAKDFRSRPFCLFAAARRSVGFQGGLDVRLPPPTRAALGPQPPIRSGAAIWPLSVEHRTVGGGDGHRSHQFTYGARRAPATVRRFPARWDRCAPRRRRRARSGSYCRAGAAHWRVCT